MIKPITREEILNMPAGIEIDMLIATEVFKRTAHPKNPKKFLGRLGRYVSPRHYSHAISAAWEILEFISSKYECSTAIGREYPFQRGTYCARFVGGKLFYDTPELKMYALAETAPLAVCRCALLAVITMESV